MRNELKKVVNVMVVVNRILPIIIYLYKIQNSIRYILTQFCKPVWNGNIF